MFIEARQLTHQPGHQEIDEAIEYATGTTQDFKQGFKQAAPAPMSEKLIDLAILASPVLFVVAGPELAGLAIAAYAVKALHNTITK